MPARGGDFDRAFDMLLTLGLAQPPFGSARQRKVSRPPRIEFASAVQHLTARGDRREEIFQD
jgi:hypothetical protein